ncbi:MAG: hypothetical protein KDD12_27225, partial [Lewinella sp.]|nr:hypothetical protein [Lewinella sp.]
MFRLAQCGQYDAQAKHIAFTSMQPRYENVQVENRTEAKRKAFPAFKSLGQVSGLSVPCLFCVPPFDEHAG